MKLSRKQKYKHPNISYAFLVSIYFELIAWIQQSEQAVNKI